MTRLAAVASIALSLAVVSACKKDTPATKPAATTEPAPFAIVLGDATVYELVGRKYDKLDPPGRELVLHSDGTVEMMFGKDGKPLITAMLKADGTMTADGKAVAVISEHALTATEGNKQMATVDGNTITVQIEDKRVTSELAADGSVTVLDSPYKTKWRIDAKDPAVRRTAFLLLGTMMKTALD
jgi:hypothetical protein